MSSRSFIKRFRKDFLHYYIWQKPLYFYNCDIKTFHDLTMKIIGLTQPINAHRQADPVTYKKRQSIVEHPSGTIKRQWGFYYVITKKGIKRASADVGFMFIAYNLRRMMNIIDKNLLTKFLRELAFLFSEILASVKALIFKESIHFLCNPLPKHFTSRLNRF